ncbi:MAG: hypothetical protein RLN88_06400 [Ekhidna sp.]|uniref:hypothetical protein n=1 Tax=Ekhidna sp. TaxID=2608089 RepID=UPI0032ECFBEB
MKKLLVIGLLGALVSCENQDINEGEKFRPRELHDSFESSHFTKIKVDGVEYLMMERDNNNPHEGFGFMAFRANKLMEKQDTIISYLKTLQYFQNKMYSRMFQIPVDSGQAEFNRIFLENLDLERVELEELEKEDLVNLGDSSTSQEEEE